MIGRICSECLVDDDCEGGGCSLPVVLATPPEPATCNDGALGDGCMTDAVCQPPLLCRQILDVTGVIQASTCSECRSDEDCGENLCAPRYDVLETRGEWVCVAPGSVPNPQGCDLEGSGDAQCASGICVAVSIMGLATLGVCGDCRSDLDCQSPQICQETTWILATATVVPAMCVDP